MNKTIVIIFFLIDARNSLAQTTENKAWFFLSHTQEVSKKWNVLADVQVRSSNELKRVETLLLRGALSYNLNNEHSVALGYAYKGDWEEELAKLKYELEPSPLPSPTKENGFFRILSLKTLEILSYSTTSTSMFNDGVLPFYQQQSIDLLFQGGLDFFCERESKSRCAGAERESTTNLDNDLDVSIK